mgnify:CR=1 FL=1
MPATVILTKHLAACVDTGSDGVSTSERGVVHRNRQHMVQTERQQQSLECTIDEWSQYRRSCRGIGDPDTKTVDTGLD